MIKKKKKKVMTMMKYHAVVHDFVPIFSGDNAKQQDDGIQRRLKVGLPVHRQQQTHKLKITSK